MKKAPMFRQTFTVFRTIGRINDRNLYSRWIVGCTQQTKLHQQQHKCCFQITDENLVDMGAQTSFKEKEKAQVFLNEMTEAIPFFGMHPQSPRNGRHVRGYWAGTYNTVSSGVFELAGGIRRGRTKPSGQENHLSVKNKTFKLLLRSASSKSTAYRKTVGYCRALLKYGTLSCKVQQYVVVEFDNIPTTQDKQLPPKLPTGSVD
ncbi:hypothetical protein CLF_103409 [Clonorchis sinensis]|uniref:Uncharacterized protein n=1 Tax=Clonorchis sinensis TaxID=79923 RepID=G7YNF7_CLOSI|nr:hypothetical protein CLF_103409 [Clonorchis sinensis]